MGKKKKTGLHPKQTTKTTLYQEGKKKNRLVEIQLATIKHAIYSFKKQAKVLAIEELTF